MLADVIDDPSRPLIREEEPGVASEDAKPRHIPWPLKALALLIAVLADTPPLCLLGESIPVLFDVGVAATLWLTLGRSPLLLVALLLECIPAVGLAPTWTAYVLFSIIFGRTGGRTMPTAIVDRNP